VPLQLATASSLERTRSWNLKTTSSARNNAPISKLWLKAEGYSWPLGASWVESKSSYNFALYSRHATSVTLLIYCVEDSVKPSYQYPLDPIVNKTGLIWYCMVPAEDIPGGAFYAYRIDGPKAPHLGHRFDSKKILLDPFAPAVFFPPSFDRDAAKRPGPTDGGTPLGLLPAQQDSFDWEDDPRPRHNHDLIVYELHVKGFTARANSGVSPGKRGTFSGLVDKIPYLKELGVTAIELLPVHQFDPQEGNYWGYMTLNFFSPHQDYAYEDPTREFRQMVKAFHAVGIEVWLDVVYNHSSEAGEDGPTHSYRGIDNKSYYLVSHRDGSYINDTGCGNTLRCAHPIVRALVLTSLEHWAAAMKIDGFRFDLASIFARNLDGSLNTQDPPLISEISLFGYLHDVRLVAEAWDIGSNLLGRSFPGLQWRQWNGLFRDDVRAFVRGEEGRVSSLMRRLYGSDDLFPEGPVEVYRPYQSVNFVTAHDGFCLYDLVAYNQKRNAANGHHNSDGVDENRSWNCGWEGDIDVPDGVMTLRRRQIKNFISLLMLANGTPMFCAGDEFMNTQRGNNNPYNQDNEITWLNWDLLKKNREMFRFFKLMIAFRKAHPSIGRGRYWREDVTWYGATGLPDLSHHSHSIAYCLHGASLDDSDFYVMINAWWEDLEFSIQEGYPGEWTRVADTSRPSPDDIFAVGQGAHVGTLRYPVMARSVVVLEKPLKKSR